MSNEEFSRAIPVYNPDLLSDEGLRRVFVARRSILDPLVDDMRKDRLQHTLFVGVRGMGKTTLLKRIDLAIRDDEALHDEWLPLTFPEEQYNVSRLSDFYLNVLDALSDALERQGDRGSYERLDAFVASLPDEEQPLREAANARLKAESKRLGRRFVLLIDNFDQIISNLGDNDAWAFRNLLEQDWLLLIGATTGYVEFVNYEKPFYDFFRTQELMGLSADEVEMVIRSFALAEGDERVLRWLEDQPGRIKALTTLTGGNPRTTVLLYNLVKQSPVESVRTDLERLLDLSTPLYKAIFEDLPQQAQQVVHELALNWGPMLAGELAERIRMEVTTISSQLSRLEKTGMVQKVPAPGTTRSAYQIGERFFNIWYLMRASRRIRRRLVWLVEFLRMFYSAPEIRTVAVRYLRADCPSGANENLRYAETALAYAEALDPTEGALRRALEHQAIDVLFQLPSLRSQIATMLSPQEDAALLSHAERRATIHAIEAAVENIQPPEGVSTSEELVDRLLLGNPSLLKAKDVAESMRNLTGESLTDALEPFNTIYEALTNLTGKTTVAQIAQAMKSGDITSPSDIEGADAIRERTGDISLSLVARALSVSSDSDERAERTMREVELNLDKNSPSYVWAAWLMYNLRTGAKNSRILDAAEIILSDKNASPASLMAAVAAAFESEDMQRAIQGLRVLYCKTKDIKTAYSLATTLIFDKSLGDASEFLLIASKDHALDAPLHLMRLAVFEALGQTLTTEDIMIASDIKWPVDGPEFSYASMFLGIGALQVTALTLKAIESTRDLTVSEHVLAGHLNIPSDPEQSVSHYKQALEKDPSNLAAVLGLTLTNLAQGRIQEAEQDLLAIEDKRSAALVQSIVRISQNDWPEVVGLANEFLGAQENAFASEKWNFILAFFGWAVLHGYAQNALELLEGIELSEKWLPLAEALKTTIEGRERLLTLPPELRVPTEEILAGFTFDRKAVRSQEIKNKEHSRIRKGRK